MHATGAGNDYQKDKQFRKLNEKKDLLDVKMIRGGSQILIPNPQIVVGDVIILQTGDKITADGIVIDSNNMVVDEASLTGESEPIKKGFKDMFCRAGTTVSFLPPQSSIVSKTPVTLNTLICAVVCPLRRNPESVVQHIVLIPAATYASVFLQTL